MNENERPRGDLTLEQAAEELQVGITTVRRYVAAGTLPGAYRIKGSRLIRIPRSGIEALKQPIRPAAV
ncbi:DNA binding domain, excisionase family [Mycolicibacterium canariasense]|uniref:DNA binding domain, excisionase family n=1 Tax=Mycolicibacterium canariasense TaxID=228230 RepID=A0A100WD01_MYCCR|nr:helix-turn-helix domain-containing protein [Mycolicibacterium canariasense]MCV7207036.1 helix-turn-helix domain-containing protein [Mycolicibacterium canariasense]ORV05611.1 hypothetical protein AWB94_19710 [Mycolicibacterium canariasense]GAS95761.1 DNA binding domain, excisionase family [Mycolicibacterium canariasense]